MKSFYGEFTKNLGYTFHIQLSSQDSTKILLTPTPECLFIQLNTQVFKIMTLFPIASLDSSICTQEDEWIYLRIPSFQFLEHSLTFKKEIRAKISQINCKKCTHVLVNLLENTYPLPSTNWEVLSELWNCHPSHEQVYSISKSSKNCYVSLFSYHFFPKALEISLKPEGKYLKCPNCSNCVGSIGEEYSLFRHKVLTPEEESIEFLLKEALIERINELNRDIHLGYLSIRLLSWDVWVYKKDRFVKGMKVMYCQSGTPGIELPEEDLLKIKQILKKNHKKLPERLRRFNEWKISYLVLD